MSDAAPKFGYIQTTSNQIPSYENLVSGRIVVGRVSFFGFL